MPAKLIDGKAIATKIRKDIAFRVELFKNKYHITPTLAVILASEDPASQVYVRHKQKACEQVGIKSLLITPYTKSTDCAFERLKEEIIKLNNNTAVHGILCQLPLPKTLQKYTTAVFDLISPLKDVDVFHPTNVGLMVQNRPRFLPCTPQGIQKMLEYSGISLDGKQVVVINRSDIVGKPLSSMLIQDTEGGNATVTVCHDRTKPKELKKITLTADIIVVAVGIPQFLSVDMVSPGAVVIDVGITRVGKKIVGDVDFVPVSEIASAISPVPGGVGPMTVTMLLENTLKAAELSCT